MNLDWLELLQIGNEYNHVTDQLQLEIPTRQEIYRQIKVASKFQFIFEKAL